MAQRRGTGQAAGQGRAVFHEGARTPYQIGSEQVSAGLVGERAFQGGIHPAGNVVEPMAGEPVAQGQHQAAPAGQGSQFLGVHVGQDFLGSVEVVDPVGLALRRRLLADAGVARPDALQHAALAFLAQQAQQPVVGDFVLGQHLLGAQGIAQSGGEQVDFTLVQGALHVVLCALLVDEGAQLAGHAIGIRRGEHMHGRQVLHAGGDLVAHGSQGVEGDAGSGGATREHGRRFGGRLRRRLPLIQRGIRELSPGNHLEFGGALVLGGHPLHRLAGRGIGQGPGLLVAVLDVLDGLLRGGGVIGRGDLVPVGTDELVVVLLEPGLGLGDQRLGGLGALLVQGFQNLDERRHEPGLLFRCEHAHAAHLGGVLAQHGAELGQPFPEFFVRVLRQSSVGNSSISASTISRFSASFTCISSTHSTGPSLSHFSLRRCSCVIDTIAETISSALVVTNSSSSPLFASWRYSVGDLSLSAAFTRLCIDILTPFFASSIGLGTALWYSFLGRRANGTQTSSVSIG